MTQSDGRACPVGNAANDGHKPVNERRHDMATIYANCMDLEEIEAWLDEHDADWWALIGALNDALHDPLLSEEIESRL